MDSIGPASAKPDQASDEPGEQLKSDKSKSVRSAVQLEKNERRKKEGKNKEAVIAPERPKTEE